MFAKENNLSNSNIQSNFAKKNTSRTSSPIPVPNPVDVHLEDGVSVKYKSHSKHTKGMPGNRPDAGIEPRDSLRLFEKSVQHGKKRYAKDNDGNIHQFNSNKEGTEWHWAGRTGKDQPEKQQLSTKDINNNVFNSLGISKKEVDKK